MKRYAFLFIAALFLLGAVEITQARSSDNRAKLFKSWATTEAPQVWPPDEYGFVCHTWRNDIDCDPYITCLL